MTIRVDKDWDTSGWPGKIRMNASPDWDSFSPEEIAQRGRPWNQDPTDLPWLDRDGAEEAIGSRRSQGLISGEEEDLLLQWVNHGYFIVESAIEESQFGLIDQFVRDLDGIWTTDQALDGLQVIGLRVEGRPSGPADHAEILSWPLATRLELRDARPWHVHYFHNHTRAGMQLTTAKKILRLCELVLGEDPVLASCIGFKRGSQLDVHQDLGAVHVHPANRLVGVWLACEDVNPEAGPLVVYPGTHRVPLWPGWNNYPQTNLRTCHPETRAEEYKYMHDAAAKYEKKTLLVRKGTAIFTHGLLIHAGDKIRDLEATRFSTVLHYTVPGANKMHEVEGPFNW